MKRDKWGLPRNRRWWLDPGFWAAAGAITLRYVPVMTIGQLDIMEGLATGGFWVLLSLLLVIEGGILWVVYDTYRWEIPERWFYLMLVLVVWPLGVAYYVYQRPRYLLELERRRHLPF